MTHPRLDPDLARALQALHDGLGADQVEVLDVHPSSPQPPPATPPAAAAPDQPGLFDPEPDPAPPVIEPYSHIPPQRRWREVLRHARPLSPTPPAERNH
jgi:hypothetical protein